MDSKESFIYTICSNDRINKEADPAIYYIDFGGFNSQYENYKCEVLSCVINRNYTTTLGYYILTARNLNDSGVFCKSKLGSDECIMSIITSDKIAKNENDYFFNVKNCRIAKRIMLEFLLPDYTPVGNAFHNLEETLWVLTLKMTPID